MNKLLISFIAVLLIFSSAQAQRIIINQNFEYSGREHDSLPTNWVKFSLDSVSGPGREWAVRDSGVYYSGSTVLKTRAHNSLRALTCPWTSGNPVADEWVITDSFTVIKGDSLIFWMLIGPDSYYPDGFLDSMQVWLLTEQNPNSQYRKLATLVSNDSAGIPLNNNTWKIHEFSLSDFIGAKVCIAFRYYMNTSEEGFWCNIDDVFVGNHSYYEIFRIGTNIPKSFGLKQNYPNPFNSSTKIKFEIPKFTYVRIEIFNSLGRLVKTLHQGFTKAGYYETSFDGNGLSSGVYFYKISTSQFTDTKKMILVK